MIEAELKVTLDAAGMARLRDDPALAELRLAPRRTRKLVSVYYDTPGDALAAAGLSLRLRRTGRAWVQTIKRRGTVSGGFFAHDEVECPAPGGQLVLDGPDASGAAAAVVEAAAGAPLAPVFETRVDRITERLGAPSGGEVEVALDTGEIVAGERRAPIIEAEIELAAGEVGAVFAVARRLFPTGPVRFSAENKAARGYRLARTGAAEAPLEPRRARRLAVDPRASVEAVARDVFRDCLDQVAANMAVVAGSDALEGPHQLRIGLRRLRTAFLVFGPSLGAATAGLSARARELGAAVGGLRDADVLIGEVVAQASGPGLDAAAAAALDAALAAALAARRAAIREEVRATLAGPDAVGFLFDLGAFVEGRGWLSPPDCARSGRLAAPIGEVAPGLLDRRRHKAMKRGRRIRELDVAGLHELRKELKKLRYAVDMLGPIYEGSSRAAAFLKSLRALQDAFGSLNDAAMAERALTGERTPAAGDPDAQRAVGWTLGTLAARVAGDRPALLARWDALAAARPFWR